MLAALLTKGRALTGADGLLASDQLQYFTWIRQAGEHGLVGNEYDMAPDDRVFLHPGFLLSGAAARRRSGISVPLSYLLWKPVAVGLLFWGALRYVRRLLPPGGARHAALILGAVRRDAGERARRVDRAGAASRASTRSTSSPASWAPPVPVGLPDDGDRGRR